MYSTHASKPLDLIPARFLITQLGVSRSTGTLEHIPERFYTSYLLLSCWIWSLHASSSLSSTFREWSAAIPMNRDADDMSSLCIFPVSIRVARAESLSTFLYAVRKHVGKTPSSCGYVQFIYSAHAVYINHYSLDACRFSTFCMSSGAFEYVWLYIKVWMGLGGHDILPVRLRQKHHIHADQEFRQPLHLRGTFL